MSKVTSKLQVTIPKAIAESYGIEPGDEIEFVPAGDVIRVIPPQGRLRRRLSVEERLRIFEESQERQRQREKTMKGWPRDWKVNLIEQSNPDWLDLYDGLASGLDKEWSGE